MTRALKLLATLEFGLVIAFFASVRHADRVIAYATPSEHAALLQWNALPGALFWLLVVAWAAALIAGTLQSIRQGVSIWRGFARPIQGPLALAVLVAPLGLFAGYLSLVLGLL